MLSFLSVNLFFYYHETIQFSMQVVGFASSKVFIWRHSGPRRIVQSIGGTFSHGLCMRWEAWFNHIDNTCFYRADNIDVTFEFMSEGNIPDAFCLLQCYRLQLHLGVQTPNNHKGLCHHLSFWFTFWRVPEHLITYIDISFRKNSCLNWRQIAWLNCKARLRLIHAYWKSCNYTGRGSMYKLVYIR
jgi:hypothetical protein